MLGYKNHLVKKFGARSGIEISYLISSRLIHIKKE